MSKRRKAKTNKELSDKLYNMVMFEQFKGTLGVIASKLGVTPARAKQINHLVVERVSNEGWVYGYHQQSGGHRVAGTAAMAREILEYHHSHAAKSNIRNNHRINGGVLGGVITPVSGRNARGMNREASRLNNEAFMALEFVETAVPAVA